MAIALNADLWTEIISSKAVNHHYIPKFFTQAFTNDEGKLHVYDKQAERFKKRQVTPKRIFYEEHLNSLAINGVRYPIVESMYSKAIDNRLANVIKAFQYTQPPEGRTDEYISKVFYFLSDMTWRLPANKYLLNSIVDMLATENPLQYAKYREVTETEDDYYRMARAGTVSYMHTREEDIEKLNGKVSWTVHDFIAPAFCISDNPILWQKFPQTLNDFNLPMIVPISKSRVLIILDQREYAFTLHDSMLLNQLMMLQADKYVACHDRELLELTVEIYEQTKTIMNRQSLIDGLFDTINKRKPPYTPETKG